MKVYRKTVKCHTFNEDRFAVSDRLFAVIDGATDLSAMSSGYRRSSASLLAERVKRELERFSGGDVVEFLHGLSKKLYNETPRLLASCGISIVYLDGDFARLYCVGDCEINYKLKSGEIVRFKQSELSALDKKATDELIAVSREKNISVKSAMPYIKPTLVKHRNMMNTPNGYDVFAPQENPCFSVLTHTLPISKLESLYVFTDGFAQAFTTLDILPSYESLFAPSIAPDDVIEEIKRVCFEDKDFNRFPRFKLIDDVTVIKLDF